MRFMPAARRRLRLSLALTDAGIGCFARGRPRRDSPGKKGCRDSGSALLGVLLRRFTFAVAVTWVFFEMVG